VNFKVTIYLLVPFGFLRAFRMGSSRWWFLRRLLRLFPPECRRSGYKSRVRGVNTGHDGRGDYGKPVFVFHDS
jgi:hypothetical protein